MKEIEAKLVLKTAKSEKTGNFYDYVGVVVDGVEVSRLFLRPLEIKALFD